MPTCTPTEAEAASTLELTLGEMEDVWTDDVSDLSSHFLVKIRWPQLVRPASPRHRQGDE